MERKGESPLTSRRIVSNNSQRNAQRVPEQQFLKVLRGQIEKGTPDSLKSAKIAISRRLGEH
jgi:hypothetical protein